MYRRLTGHCHSLLSVVTHIPGDSCMLQGLELTDEEDLDVDQIANNCDDDDDGDGVVDNLDNCPSHMNNGAFFYTECQWIHTRLVASRTIVYNGLLHNIHISPNGLLFEDIEEDLEPTAGDDITLWDERFSYWVPYSSSTELTNFNAQSHFSSSPTPREVFPSLGFVLKRHVI